MFNVHLRINDAQTRQPTPVRLRITDASGRTWPPLGRLADFAHGAYEDVGGHLALGRERWCYIDGACEVPLPSQVPLTIEAIKGPEYRPLRQEVTLGPGQMALRLTLERTFDLRSQGWYSGDTRCHALSPHSALLEARAEDLSVVQILATERSFLGSDGHTHDMISNITAFSGQAPALQHPDAVVAVNTLNTHLLLGKLALLHCHRAVFPLSFGGHASTDDWSLADWCDQCHRKKGLVVWVDPFDLGSGIGSEALADLILGRIDAVEATPSTARLRDWYSAWSMGLRFSLVGASGKESNRTPLGVMRTYAAAPSPALGDWIEAVRAGRTFVSTGPLLELSADGNPPGTVVQVPEGTETRIQAIVRSVVTPGPLELVFNGAVIARGTDRVEIAHRFERSGWLAARCTAAPSTAAFAHTSPIWIEAAIPMERPPETVRIYDAQLERTKDWIETQARFEIPRRREALLAVIHQARQRLASP